MLFKDQVLYTFVPIGTSDEHLSLLEHLAPLQARLSSIIVTNATGGRLDRCHEMPLVHAVRRFTGARSYREYERVRVPMLWRGQQHFLDRRGCFNGREGGPEVIGQLAR